MADPPRPATPPVTGDDATLVAADAPLASSATILDRRTAGRAAARPEATIQGRRRGDALGRYVLLDELGRGGMGVVYAAYDPELERKVAVKLLQGGGGETSGRAWLAREAQAMAQLAHPNVVAIHDVGTVDGQLYIAMEHVEGETLAAWLAADRRSLREILAVFLQAGEGLQAAHAAGLVHRDFKPDNVMLSADGRVRVMDFGLARPERAAAGPRPPPLREGASALDSVLTRAGAIMGTPRYMAPEQWAGDEADARSDLFSFCVALWEALHGAHPFRGESMADLAIAVAGGILQPPPPGSRVPARLRRALARGLAALPEQRWPSMRALLDELGRDPGPRRRRLGALVGLVVGLGLGLGGWHLDRQAKQDACAREGAAITAVWNDEARARIGDALAATGLPSANTSVRSIAGKLDGFAAAWSTAREETCLAATLDDAVDPGLHDQIRSCLDEQLAEAATLITILGEADRAVALRGAAATASLRPPALCTDRSWLGPYEPLPVSLALPVSALRRAFARVNALTFSGELEAAHAAAQAAQTLATALDIPLLSARADLARGMVAQRRGDAEAARDALEAAFYRAGSLGADEIAADAAGRLVFVVGYRLSDLEGGLRWARVAEMELARLGVDDDDVRRAPVANGRGVLALAAGDTASAQVHLREALRIARLTHGPDHPGAAGALGNIATLHWARGEYEASLALNRQSLELRERVLGPDHPDVAIDLNNVGANLQALGRIDESVATHERALAIREAALGPTSAEVAETLDNLCSVYFAIQRIDAAERACLRAIAIRDQNFGAESPHAAYARLSLIQLRRLRGERDHAAELDALLATLEAAYGPESPDLAAPINVRGWVALVDEHDPAGALLRGEAARRLVAGASGRAEGVAALSLIGEAELELGRPAAAAAAFDVALAEFAGRERSDLRIASGLRFGLARALGGLGREPARARALAEEARSLLVEAIEAPLLRDDAKGLLEIDAWLRDRADP